LRPQRVRKVLENLDMTRMTLKLRSRRSGEVMANLNWLELERTKSGLPDEVNDGLRTRSEFALTTLKFRKDDLVARQMS
jgi:hypothetical protein